MEIEYPEWMARYQKPEFLAGGALLVFVLVMALVWTAWRWNIALDRMEMMQAQAAVGFLQPPSSTRTLRVDPRAGGVTGIDASGLPQRIDLLISMKTDRYKLFRLSLLRDDGTALLHAERLARDSNDDLRISLNSTLLPNGIYRIRIAGYTWRGQLQPIVETRIQLIGR